MCIIKLTSSSSVSSVSSLLALDSCLFSPCRKLTLASKRADAGALTTKAAGNLKTPQSSYFSNLANVSRALLLSIHLRTRFVSWVCNLIQ